MRQVLPLAPESISNRDGSKKSKIVNAMLQSELCAKSEQHIAR
jgi:hypothetical protein